MVTTMRNLTNLVIVFALIVFNLLPISAEELTACYWLDQANNYYNEGSYDIALLSLNKSLEIGPSNVQ